MKYKYIIFLCLFGTLFGQTSLDNLSKLSNSELDLIKNKLKSNQEPILSEDKLLSMDISDSVSPKQILIESSSYKDNTKGYFGYDYFQKNINFYDNIPTPSDFKLGPGDEIILSLWGEANSREKFRINKEGLIYYENIGFINISNKTLEEAESVLIEELSRIYSTLKNNNSSTDLMLELGKLKSVNVYFTGQIASPGLHLIHPFSDVFSAIIQAGSVLKEGSLRKIEIIRSNEVIGIVDFYSLFVDGRNTFSNIRIMDGDIIHIPTVKKRVSISGEVNRPSAYELLSNESISDIITYASGFTSEASSTLIISQTVPLEERASDDNAKTSVSINLKNKESIILNNGDTITVPPISSVDLSVTVYGRVKAAGSYPGVNTTLKNVLDIAGGFDDPLFRKTIREDKIIVLRRDRNQFYGKEIAVSYKNADQFKLEVNDKIFIYEDINYRNSFTYRVEGEVYRPGTYPFRVEGLTVGRALSIAGGLTDLTSERNITVTQSITDVDDDGNEITTSETINNITLDFEIGVNSVIIAFPFENIVRVQGNVYNPGLLAYQDGATLPRYIELAGGYKPDTMKRKVYIKRANGNIEKTNRIFGKKLYAGDTVIVPVDPDPPVDFDVAAFTADILSVLANLAAILLIVDNNNGN